MRTLRQAMPEVFAMMMFISMMMLVFYCNCFVSADTVLKVIQN